MTLGYIYTILIADHIFLTAASTISVDPTATATEAKDALSGAAGMLRRAQSPALEAGSKPESLVDEKMEAESLESMSAEDLVEDGLGAGSEWVSTDHAPISTYFNFAEYGQRYREAAGLVQRKTPADALSRSHQKELRFFVRSLLEEAEDFEAKNILKNTKGKSANDPGVPSWFHGGNGPHTNVLKFEYQSAIGRDGFEADPTEPVCEYFGPFKIDYGLHTVFLQNWNLKIGTKLDRWGMGNVIVGLNHTYENARNGVVVGHSNSLKGQYGFVAGDQNVAIGRGAVVSGGYQNDAAAEYSNVNGGQKNNVSVHFSVVSGGYGNMASAPWSTAGGGENNIVDGFSATVMGGNRNQALANLSAITGGGSNEIPPTAVSETVIGGHAGNVPTPEPPKDLVIEPGEYTSNAAQSTHELNYAALGCTDESSCEQEEEEEEEEEEDEHDNPATHRRVIEVEQVHENGDSRRRTPHDLDENMEIMAPPS
jgi:hypothetical protein